MILLTISHHIFLTDEERHALANRVAINVVGISVPLWIKQGKMPMMAEEIFCRYYLRNIKNTIETVTAVGNGYSIQLPQDGRRRKPTISDEAWRSLSENEKISWYANNSSPLTSDNLLDIPDGAGGFLSYHHNNKVDDIDVVHFVEIKPMKVLEESLV